MSQAARVWQTLKVFEQTDMDTSEFHVRSMRGLSAQPDSAEVVPLNYTTSPYVSDPTTPLSYAALVAHHIAGTWSGGVALRAWGRALRGRRVGACVRGGLVRLRGAEFAVVGRHRSDPAPAAVGCPRRPAAWRNGAKRRAGGGRSNRGSERAVSAGGGGRVFGLLVTLWSAVWTAVAVRGARQYVRLSSSGAVRVAARVERVEAPRESGAPDTSGVPVVVAFQNPATGEQLLLPTASARNGTVAAAWVGRTVTVRFPAGRPYDFRVEDHGAGPAREAAQSVLAACLALAGLGRRGPPPLLPRRPLRPRLRLRTDQRAYGCRTVLLTVLALGARWRR